MPMNNLDSHDNVALISKFETFLLDTGRTADVAHFTPEHESLSKVPIVEVAAQCDHPKTGESIMLEVKNGLDAPSVDHNLAPPFMLNDPLVEVKPSPKNHMNGPFPEGHWLCFKEKYFRMPLDSHGVFSCFPSESPSSRMLSDPKTRLSYLTSEGLCNLHHPDLSEKEKSAV